MEHRHGDQSMECPLCYAGLGLSYIRRGAMRIETLQERVVSKIGSRGAIN